jgi:DNA-binding NtrC family response regulator
MNQAELERLLIGDSLPMRRLRALIERVATSMVPVLIQGETGSGKELVARALHGWSGRPGPLVALNVCALPDSMFEASMFGHVRGAFTGALRDAVGFMTEAHRGTLFLDEISGLSVASQMKLLRAVETKEFRPVGGRADQRSDFRLVSASNEELSRMVETGRFRRDLAQRMSGLRLLVPPLRERMDDIPALAGHFARATPMRTISEVELNQGVVRVLQTHCWPGNVRELRHVIEAAVALSGGAPNEDDVVSLMCPDVPAGASVMRQQYESRELLDMLERFSWNIDEVASMLGVHRATIYRRLRRVGLDAQRGLGSARRSGETLSA